MSVSKKQDIKLEFKISNIELIEKSFHIPVFQGDITPVIQFDLAINVSVAKENKKIANILQVKMMVEDSNTVVASITVGCTFDIINFEEVVIISGESETIPDAIIETLNIITIGTSRGIMFNEFKGTWLHHSILPVIDPKSFKQEKSTIN